MLNRINIHTVLFLDIETVPIQADYNSLPDQFQKLWDHKCERISRSEIDTPDQLFERAGIYAEFGKIVCISVGFFNGNQFRLKSFYGDKEEILLKEFSDLLNKSFNRQDQLLCAHNGKEFDYPYIARRMLINGIDLPYLLDIAGKKPWEILHLDTLELWKFGDYKHYTSLNLLTAVFDIPTPKDDINGSDIARVYWQDHDLERIAHYCQKDVVAVAQLLMRYKGKPLIKDSQIEYVD